MKKGFTLIEMTVVLFIIGILAGIVLRNIGGQSVQARDSRRISDIRIISNYLAQYLAKQGQFPSNPDHSGSGWSALSTALNNAGIVVNLPRPPAGDPYVYYPCSDIGGIINHFIIRTRLEQSQTQAPAIYEGSYNNAGAPSGWTCNSPAGQSLNCSWANRYYCITE
jgi:general secretion pathway protein G